MAAWIGLRQDQPRWSAIAELLFLDTVSPARFECLICVDVIDPVWVPKADGAAYIVLDDFGNLGRFIARQASTTATEPPDQRSAAGQFHNPVRVIASTPPKDGRPTREEIARRFEMHAPSKTLTGMSRRSVNIQSNIICKPICLPPDCAVSP